METKRKDPACLFYIDTWLSSTAEMDSDVRGWYLNLILHQFDKKDLPNDVEKLAVLAGVKFSEFERFKQMLNQVLMQKFKLNENNRLENDYCKQILQGRELFKDKRALSGNIGVVIKIAKTIKGFTDKHLDRLKKELYQMEIEQVDKHKDKQVLEQMLKLYINGNRNEDNNKEINIFDHTKFIELFNTLTNKNFRVLDDKAERQIKKLLEKGYTKDDVVKAIKNCLADEFHILNPNYLTPEFITREDKFTKYYTAISKPQMIKQQEVVLPYHKKVN